MFVLLIVLFAVSLIMARALMGYVLGANTIPVLSTSSPCAYRSYNGTKLVACGCGQHIR
jgi:hypothetical protein